MAYDPAELERCSTLPAGPTFASRAPAALQGVATDESVQLLVPRNDVADPEVSIVIPALNEEITIGQFVEWCKEGLARAGVEGEILIVDSSSDRTTELAVAHGARVLKTPRRGLGRAYIDALPHVRGRYTVMGDADCTYDFRELAPFLERFRQGYEFVMGSRWKGSIEDGSMPALHQYVGTPVTTWMLNVLYASRFSDIHCGMRGITTDALRRMGLQSQSWEYASEMVLKSVHMRLATAEVPVRFLKDQEGRLSHHKRAGWFSPFQAAWINMRAMFVYGAEFFTLRPGLALLAVGLLLTVPLALGPVQVGPVHFSLHWMLLGLTLVVVGLQSFYVGCLAQVLHDYTGAARRRWLRVFSYTRTVAVSALAFIVGLSMTVLLVVEYVRGGLTLSLASPIPYLGVLGLVLLISSFLTFTFLLLLHALTLRSDATYGLPE
ncbi:MAG: glycosyltransferase family 2 protein [Candidatus Dormibacteraeota bacterium]|nr:glycosyltransferase family 2 protein [Candidatus Dormibacteraeota bacterium]